MRQAIGVTMSQKRTPLLLLIVLALVAATIVETMAAVDLGAEPELPDYLFTTFVMAIPVVGWSWAGSRGSRRAGWLAMTTGAIAAAAWSFHAAVVWMTAHQVEGWIFQAAAWPGFWLPVVAFAPLAYCVPLSGDTAVMSRWLRLLGIVGGVGITLAAAAQGIAPDVLDGDYHGLVVVDNPLGAEALGGIAELVTAWGVGLFGVFAGAGLWDGILRWRRDGEGTGGLVPVLRVAAIAALSLMALILAGLLAGEIGFVALWALAVIVLTSLLIATSVRATAESARANRVEMRSRAAVEVRVEERRNLRRDLHDGVGPALAAIGIQLDLLADHSDDDVEITSLVDGARKAVDSARTELRSIVDGLRPALLDELGFLPALKARCGALGGTDGEPRVRLHAHGDLTDLPDPVAVAIIAACGEATANAVRHSGGSTCVIELERSAERLIVQVKDDGAWREPPSPGHGLGTMRERIEELGGTFDVHTSESGTTVTMSVWLS